MAKYSAILLMMIITLSGCTTQISGNILSDLASSGSAGQAGQILINDLQTAEKNLDIAVSDGLLAKDDPAPGCLHMVLQRAGIEAAPGAPSPQPFVAQVDGLISAGSVLYIRFQQGKALAQGGLPTDCKTLVGQIVVDGVAIAKHFP